MYCSTDATNTSKIAGVQLEVGYTVTFLFFAVWFRERAKERRKQMQEFIHAG